jgi:hypothetical protein
MSDMTPETFKTRFHLDLLTRLTLYMTWKMLNAQGLTGEQCQRVLVTRLEGDRANIDAMVSDYFSDPAIAGAYAEQASQVIDEMETSFARLVDTMQRRESET